MSPARAWTARAVVAGTMLAASLSVGVASVGHAQDVPPEAVEFYRLAREYYGAGQYAEAAVELERALTLDPDSPTLVFNLARVYELLGELDRSLEFYERYQRLLPEQQARDQERAEATIRRLQGARENQEDEPPPPPTEVEPLLQLPGVVLVRVSGVADLGFWLTLGIGAASLAAGVGFGVAALDARGSANSYGNAPTFGIITDVTLGLGGGLVLASLLLYFLRDQTVERAPIGAGEVAPAPEPSATLLLDEGLVGVALEGGF